MGLWQKLLGWLNPSAPTAAPADTLSPPAAAVAASAPQDPAARGTREPAFDPAAELAAPVSSHSSASDAQQSPVAAAASDAAPSAQADLFEAAAAREADIPAAIADPALREALSTYAGMAWDRQLDFADKVGDRPWSADTAQGLIAFGDDLRFRMQVLGSYAFESGTWQWIWANTQAEVAPAFTEVARQLLGFGNAQQLALFTQPRSTVREEDLHTIGLIAAGADESAGYYLGNYGEGILLALIDPGHGLPAPATSKPERVLTVVPQLISEFELNHRMLLRHYLEAKGFAVQDDGDQVTASQGATRVSAKLDAQGRIAAINGSIN